MIVAVGGMIGSGKSTLVKDLAEVTDLVMMEEFAEDDEVFNTILGWLYSGKEDVEMLLQVYFLHKHYTHLIENEGKDVIIDRHMIEHWLFAQNALQSKPRILNMYNSLFHTYINDIPKVDLYIILNINWDKFVERIHKRGRKQEIENFEANIPYFKNLINNYTKKLEAQCIIYNIPYVVLHGNADAGSVKYWALEELKKRKLI